MLQLSTNILRAERQELRKCLGRVRICHTLHQLVNGTDSIRSHVVTRIIEDHVEHHVVQRLGQMYADLAESAADSVNKIDWMV